MKAITRTLLALFIVSAGFAWATDGGLEEQLPVPSTQAELQSEVETQVEPESTITAEDLEAMQGEEVEVVNCCLGDCYDEWADCITACTDLACRNECRQEREACKANC